MPELISIVAPPGPTTVNRSTSPWQYAPIALFFGLLWFEVVHHLGNEWSYNPQYSYGWSVPFLMAYLLWRRWSSRPDPSTPASRSGPLLLVAFGALLAFPLRFLSGANPDWRLLSWATALNAVAVSLAFVYFVGGRAWFRHFLFPVLFICVAVPWPAQFEQGIIQGLMQFVSAINVAFINAIGIPAVQHGNVIEVRAGLIGIEEACSGVRSLQATFMISIFLGELFAFRFGFRALLVAAGAFVAFACNLFRTGFLVWITSTKGVPAAEGWHDSAGFSILFVCLFALWFIALGLQRIEHRPNETGSLPAHRESLSPWQWNTVFGFLALWLLLVEGGTQAWYKNHSFVGAEKWAARWPTTEPAYQTVPIPPATTGLLRYDDGGGAAWNDEQNRRWMMFFFRWLPGRAAALFVKIHRPDVCLPASGLTLIHDSGMRLLRLNGVSLPVRSYRFEVHGMPLHVMYCYRDARSSYETEAAANTEDWSMRGRIHAALRGQRENGAQMLELVVLGYEDDAEADAALQRQLSEVIRPG